MGRAIHYRERRRINPRYLAPWRSRLNGDRTVILEGPAAPNYRPTRHGPSDSTIDHHICIHRCRIGQRLVRRNDHRSIGTITVNPKLPICPRWTSGACQSRDFTLFAFSGSRHRRKRGCNFAARRFVRSSNTCHLSKSRDWDRDCNREKKRLCGDQTTDVPRCFHIPYALT